MQRKVYHQSKEKVPKELNLDKETFEKSRLYGLVRKETLKYVVI